jgi:hypothetical protein
VPNGSKTLLAEAALRKAQRLNPDDPIVPVAVRELDTCRLTAAGLDGE